MVRKSISDGPYIFIEKGELIEKRILNNEVTTRTLDKGSYDTLYYPDLSTFNGIRKIAAFSDIHGQYDLLVSLLVNNKIIDKDLNWNFGEKDTWLLSEISLIEVTKLMRYSGLFMILKVKQKKKVAEFIIF